MCAVADDLRGLALDLGKAAGVAASDVDAVVKKAAQNVKEQMQADASASKWRPLARTISYDRTSTLGGPTYEVGPDRSRGGGAGLAGAYYGWPNGGGATLSLDGPIDAEEPRLTKALGDLLGGIL